MCTKNFRRYAPDMHITTDYNFFATVYLTYMLLFFSGTVLWCDGFILIS